MTYNTGNPIGSADARDRSDNSENLDFAVNSLSQTFVDRLGVTRSTYEGAVQGLSFFNVGTFAVGFTLTNSRQTLTYDGHEYGWSGVFPKVVSAGSTPTPLGSGGWIDRSDVTLRGDIEASVFESLRRSYADAGFTLVGGSFESGGTLTNTNDVLLHKASGIAYSWGGTLPITVAHNSTPTPIGSDGWIDRSAVTLRSDVTAHEAKAGAHAISGVAGLQDALDGKASAPGLSSLSSSVAAIDTRVTALETRKSTCLVNAVGTGAPHETVSAALPVNITANTRYVLSNPFGVNTPVECLAQILLTGKWADPGFIYSGYGINAGYVQGEGVVLQTGAARLCTTPAKSGGLHGIDTEVASAPCRVFVRKLEA